jgi:hypothetical protein
MLLWSCGGGVYVCKYNASQQLQHNSKWWISRTVSLLQFGQVGAAKRVWYILGRFSFIEYLECNFALFLFKFLIGEVCLIVLRNGLRVFAVLFVYGE